MTPPGMCPCADAHRRLMDLHEDIHRAIESYMDPNEFRRWLNSAIQNSRGVTFLIQKRKSKWSDFDSWYGEWQEAAKANPVLRWGVTARNRVVKEEELKTFSEARISLYGDRLEEVEDAWVVPPEFTVEMIIGGFARASAKSSAKRHGTIRVQRRWVDDQLPEYELVSALREMFRAVAEIVNRAHKASTSSSCTLQSFARPCITAEIAADLPCLPPGNPIPDALYDLETGQVSRFKYVKVERDEGLIKIGQERYGVPPGFSNDPIEHAMERLELSKQFLETDGYSGPILVLFKGDEVHMHAVIFADNEPRELKIAAAVESEGAWQFDGAVFSSETWLERPSGRGSIVGVPNDLLLRSNTEFFNSDPVGGRDEGLVVMALTADHRARCIIQPFGRTASGIVYGPIVDERRVAGDGKRAILPMFLRPLSRHWQGR